MNLLQVVFRQDANEARDGQLFSIMSDYAPARISSVWLVESEGEFQLFEIKMWLVPRY